MKLNEIFGTTPTKRGGYSGTASQAQSEITWIKKKIAKLELELEKRPSVAKQIKDLQRQIKERELAIGFTA